MVSRVIRRKHSPFWVGVFSLQKYFKIILKSLQKVVDKLKKVCYIIDTPNERELNKMKTVDYEILTNDMNEFFDGNASLFDGCTKDEAKAICMMFGAMKQAIENL